MKVPAEVKAQTLETDLVPMQKEQDVEHVSLTEETEHWKQVAQEQKVWNEIVHKTMEMRVDPSEEESDIKIVWWMFLE